jgi:hypothetical protein
MTGTRIETLREITFTSWMARDFGCPLWLADRLWPLVCQRFTIAQAQLLTHGTGWGHVVSDHDLRRAITPHTLLLACDEAFPTSLKEPRPTVVREVESAILQRMRHADQWQEG